MALSSAVSSCGEKYIHQTGTLMSIHILELIRSLKNMDTEESAVTEHFPRTNNHIEFEKTQTLF